MKKNSVVLVALLTLSIDQIFKEFVSRSIELHSTLKIISGFNLVHIKNRGISFGLFSDHSLYGPYILSFVSICIIFAMSIWAYKSTDTMQKVALGLMIGGALGNVVDRLADKAVTDFLDFYYGAYHWPAFNLADVAIVCGAALLFYKSFLMKEKDHECQ